MQNRCGQPRRTTYTCTATYHDQNMLRVTSYCSPFARQSRPSPSSSLSSSESESAASTFKTRRRFAVGCSPPTPFTPWPLAGPSAALLEEDAAPAEPAAAPRFLRRSSSIC